MNSRRKLFYKLIVSYNDLKKYDNKISMYDNISGYW